MLLFNPETAQKANPPEIIEFSREFFIRMAQYMQQLGYPGGIGSPIEKPLTQAIEMTFMEMNQR